jgi:hypothetical protein
MDEDKNNIVVSPDELKADEEATKEVKEDELRDKLAEEFGLNPDDDVDLLEKLVSREKSHHEKLTGAIKQKINWREKAKVTSKNSDNGEDNKSNKETPDVGDLVKSTLNEILEERDLESLGLSDELKAEIKDLAKLKGISVREAANLPYIQSRKEEAEREERIKNATPKRSGKAGYVSNIDPSKPLNPADFALDTEEGRKAWNEARAAREKYRQTQ